MLAIDAKTGKLLWSFATIPLNHGLRYNTWPLHKATRAVARCGTRPSSTGPRPRYVGSAIDPVLGLKASRVRSSSREHLALHVDTGKLAWHFQTSITTSGTTM